MNETMYAVNKAKQIESPQKKGEKKDSIYINYFHKFYCLGSGVKVTATRNRERRGGGGRSRRSSSSVSHITEKVVGHALLKQI